MQYKGRRLPLQVRFGENAESTPAHVSQILDGKIVLAGDSPTLIRCGLAAGIEFARGVELFSNVDLMSKMFALNEIGILFGCDPKDINAAAGLMMYWQDMGWLKSDFQEITWSAPNRWLITTVEPPIVGLSGWQPPSGSLLAKA